jgi:hypothetical protein
VLKLDTGWGRAPPPAIWHHDRPGVVENRCRSSVLSMACISPPPSCTEDRGSRPHELVLACLTRSAVRSVRRRGCVSPVGNGIPARHAVPRKSPRCARRHRDPVQHQMREPRDRESVHRYPRHRDRYTACQVPWTARPRSTQPTWSSPIIAIDSFAELHLRSHEPSHRRVAEIEFDPAPQRRLERETRLELATPTLAR